jgi:ATP-dependent Clp protease ATP-binding subunit ClpB
LDELEKASEEVYNILLSLIDEGYIMDAFGRKIDCRNIFVIATSNAGSELIRELVGSGTTSEELQEKVVEHVMRERIFAPEFINRFDGVVVYEPLSSLNLAKIAKLQLSALKERMLEKNIHIDLPDQLYEKVAQDGYHPVFGARPMRRVVDLSIADLISQALLAETIAPGDRVRIVPGQNKLEYYLEKLT